MVISKGDEVRPPNKSPTKRKFSESVDEDDRSNHVKSARTASSERESSPSQSDARPTELTSSPDWAEALIDDFPGELPYRRTILLFQPIDPSYCSRRSNPDSVKHARISIKSSPNPITSSVELTECLRRTKFLDANGIASLQQSKFNKFYYFNRPQHPLETVYHIEMSGYPWYGFSSNDLLVVITYISESVSDHHPKPFEHIALPVYEPVYVPAYVPNDDIPGTGMIIPSSHPTFFQYSNFNAARSEGNHRPSSSVASPGSRVSIDSESEQSDGGDSAVGSTKADSVVGFVDPNLPSPKSKLPSQAEIQANYRRALLERRLMEQNPRRASPSAEMLMATWDDDNPDWSAILNASDDEDNDVESESGATGDGGDEVEQNYHDGISLDGCEMLTFDSFMEGYMADDTEDDMELYEE